MIFMKNIFLSDFCIQYLKISALTLLFFDDANKEKFFCYQQISFQHKNGFYAMN